MRGDTPHTQGYTPPTQGYTPLRRVCPSYAPYAGLYASTQGADDYPQSRNNSDSRDEHNM